MSISLTSSGLHLDPPAYANATGTNYGTPMMVDSNYMIPGGTWSGIRWAFKNDSQTGYTVYPIVSTYSSITYGGGYLLQNCLKPHFRRERRIA